MKITFPEKQLEVAELFIDGNPVRYKLPPAMGTHSECYASSNYPIGVRKATGREIVSYIYGALAHRKNEWADQGKIRFPTLNYLRAPKVLTIVPKLKEFGDLEGAMIIDNDLNGEGIAMKTEVPANLCGWEVSEGGILKRNGRIVVPYGKWYKKQWDEKNGAVIGIFEGIDSAVLLDKTATDSGRSKPLLKVDPAQIKTPEKRVPVVGGGYAGRFCLDCDDDGYGREGCALRVLS